MGVLELPRSAGYTRLQSWIVALLVLHSVKLSEGFAVSPWSYPSPSSGTVMFAAKPADANPPPPQHVVIAGAGIIGVSTAYFLAKDHGIRTTLVDPTGHIAPAASGKAGGFLARDWNDNGPTGPLTRRSFQLHQQLADHLGAESIQYRRLKCASIQVDPASGRRPAGKKLQGVEWVDNSLGMQELGDEETIAQVHPKMLCERMWEETVKLVPECTLKQGKVVGSERGPDDDKFEGANIMGEDGGETTLQGDALLYACGPWTKGIMYGIKYHSVILPTDRVLNQCVFFSGCGDPEVYVRPDSTAYCTGFPEPARVVTEKPGEEVVSADRVKTIVDAVRKASNGALSLKTDTATEQACYLPTTEDGIPVMGAIAGKEGCFIASGHTCWGILMGPASGESMANLIATGSSPHVDLDPFTPRRFDNIE